MYNKRKKTRCPLRAVTSRLNLRALSLSLSLLAATPNATSTNALEPLDSRESHRAPHAHTAYLCFTIAPFLAYEMLTG